jgi:DUF177 domain-containing protein
VRNHLDTPQSSLLDGRNVRRQLAKLGAVPLRTDTFDLGGLRLTPGEARRLDLNVAIDPFSLGGERYTAEPELVPVRLDVSRMTGEGYALRLRFQTTLSGPCMRCLEPAMSTCSADAREVHQPGGSDDLSSPYVERQVLDLHAWARDALALALPAKLLCRAECAGLCPVCGANLNREGPEHHHESEPDQRWAKLSELRFE